MEASLCLRRPAVPQGARAQPPASKSRRASDGPRLPRDARLAAPATRCPRNHGCRCLRRRLPRDRRVRSAPTVLHLSRQRSADRRGSHLASGSPLPARSRARARISCEPSRVPVRRDVQARSLWALMRPRRLPMKVTRRTALSGLMARWALRLPRVGGVPSAAGAPSVAPTRLSRSSRAAHA